MERMKNDTLTVIIIAKNEEARLRDCIESVRWATEIIVVDNGSTDKTQEMAKRLKVHVVSATNGAFDELRNIGLSYAHGDWVLYLDADERVTQKLADALRSVMDSYQAESPKGYYITRKNYYLGVLWPTPDKMHRFFRREFLRGWKGSLHETAIVEGTVATITEPLIHDTHRTLTEMVAKTNRWSEIEAALRLQSNHPPVVSWRLIRVYFTGFLRTYVQGGGWRAGTVGMIESMYQGFSMFITYAKLWELQKNHDTQKNP